MVRFRGVRVRWGIVKINEGNEKVGSIEEVLREKI